MSSDEERRLSSAAARPPRWLSWFTLVAGAVLCAIAVLLS